MLTGFVEGGVKRDGDGDEDGGEEDKDVPAGLAMVRYSNIIQRLTRNFLKSEWLHLKFGYLSTLAMP